MITIMQIRAARGLLGWSQTELAERSDLTQRTITDIETAKRRASSPALQAIETALTNGGIEFIDGGVREKNNHLTVIKGDNFADDYLDRMYNILEKDNIKEVLLNGINQEHLTPAARAKVLTYAEKIKALNVKERLIVPKTLPTHLMTADISQYRGLDWNFFSDTTPTFIFGDYYAMMMFDIGEVWIVHNASLANFQRKQFELLWKCGTPFAK